MRHLMSPLDFSVDELDRLLDLANDIESQSDLCRRLQLAGVIVERDVISRIENGGRFVADFEVVVIADVLEVSVDWLLGKE